MREEVQQIKRLLEEQVYVTDAAVATALYLSMTLGKPLLVEGPAGVGKTEIAKVLAKALNTKLIRLQCYEGLDATTALYEWNYPRQLLHIKLEEASPIPEAEKEATIFSEAFLLKRPLLQAITEHERAPVLLIDEIDRSDEEFEAFLLEVLSDFQVTIPEIGTITATHRPHVVLTSNRSRDLSDALASLFVSLDRLPVARKRARDRNGTCSGDQRDAFARRDEDHPADADDEFVEGAGSSGDARLGHCARGVEGDASRRRSSERDARLLPERRS